MEHLQLILTIVLTSLFCLGWSIITDNGNILEWIRKPFEDSIDEINQYENRLSILEKFDKSNKELIGYLKRKIFYNKVVYYFGKPFVLCITCYSSIWGFSVFVALNGLHLSTIPHIIINCISAAFLNTLIYKIYAKLD